MQAAQLALQSGAEPTLDILDTGGTVGGAAAAAEAAVANGDALILGPLTSAETAAVAPISRAAGVGMLAFTNDASQSQQGVWTLGISPDEQISRLVTAAQAQGRTQIAALLPATDFGRAMANALTKAMSAQGLAPPTVKMYSPGMAAITAAARDLSDYADRRGPIDAKVKAARALGTVEGRRESQELVKTPIPPPPFNVLLLADTGDELQEVAAILPYFDIDRSAVQIIGPALWADPTSGSAAVAGSWYAAPDNNMRTTFDRNFVTCYGADPPPLADLAFDAAAIARIVINHNGFDLTALTQPSGFMGADGWIVFSADGQVKRGLAVFKVERAGPTIVDPAPDSSKGPGL